MAITARKEPDDTGEIKTKDFDKALNLYVNDIKPARSKASEFMQEISTAFKAVKSLCHIQPSAMKAAIKVVELEDAKREDWLRGFNGYLRKAGIDPDPKDMVDQMEGKADKYARPKPAISLVTLGTGDDSDLADPSGAEPQSDTGAAAMAAMRAADAEQFDED